MPATTHLELERIFNGAVKRIENLIPHLPPEHQENFRAEIPNLRTDQAVSNIREFSIHFPPDLQQILFISTFAIKISNHALGIQNLHSAAPALE